VAESVLTTGAVASTATVSDYLAEREREIDAQLVIDAQLDAVAFGLLEARLLRGPV